MKVKIKVLSTKENKKIDVNQYFMDGKTLEDFQKEEGKEIIEVMLTGIPAFTEKISIREKLEEKGIIPYLLTQDEIDATNIIRYKIAPYFNPKLSTGEVNDYIRHIRKLKTEKERKEKKLVKTKKSLNQQTESGNIFSLTETPKGIEKQQLLTIPITYREVAQKVEVFLPGYEYGLRVALAVAISCKLPLPVLLWIMLVDVPSSGKTDLARLLRDSSFSYHLDTLTQNAFITGERATESQPIYDLLPLLDRKCFIIKDLSATFSLNEQMTKKILGDLINIYDKEYSKHSSRRGTIAYESYFSFIGAITPATLNRHTNYLNMLGPRFLCYKLPAVNPKEEEKSKENIFDETQDRSVLEKETRLYVSSYVEQLIKKPFVIKSFSPMVKQYIWLAAQFMSRCRGIILTQISKFKNDEGKEITYYEVLDVQTEKPWRALQQLIGLAKCLAFVVGKDEVGIEELTILRDIVIASMPADRSKALRIVAEKNGTITAKELAESSEVSHRTSSRLLEELCGLKVLDKISGSGSMAAEYHIIDKFRNFVCLNPQEFLSSYSSGTETPKGIENNNAEEPDTGFNPETKEFEDLLAPVQTTLDLKKQDDKLDAQVPEELLAIDKNSSWTQYLPVKPVTNYTDGQLDQALRMLNDYPEQMIKLLGSEGAYHKLEEKFLLEAEKRTTENAEINF